ncbi:hypothetical protein AMTR_s00008p00172060 [Amborella trichopoda]|uniref:Uncharacterized protein n=1 Tax=Amborella trichopoda TaxID=13333 RepID=W1NIL3_AMBTC|nr:hypothetical protein AMTR_s00008p00172060 [Amborella trichopoda]
MKEDEGRKGHEKKEGRKRHARTIACATIKGREINKGEAQAAAYAAVWGSDRREGEEGDNRIEKKTRKEIELEKRTKKKKEAGGWGWGG